MRISRFSRVAALAIGVAIASGTVALLEPYTGCLGLVLVILFTHLLGRDIGRLSAAFVSTGIVWVLVGLPHPVLASSSITRSIVTILAAWLCAELVSRRPRKPVSNARMKDDPFDLPIERLASQLWSRTIDGQPEYMNGRKIAESRLRSQVQNFRRMVDCVPACVCVADPAGKLVYVNKVGLATLGRPREEVVGDLWMNYIHPTDVEAARAQWAQCIEAGRPVDVVVRMQQYDGAYRWQRLLAEPFYDKGVVVNWYLVCTNIDDLKETEVALQHREHQLREITETIPGMIWCTDAGGQPTYLNRRLAEYAGVDISETRDLGYRKTIHPDDWERVFQRWKHSVQTGEPYTGVRRMRSKDGQYRWYQVRAEAMRDADGNIVQWYGLNIDIDEQKRAEDSLREVQTQLARATRIATVAELSASIAHELNQPLTSVIANAHACRRWLAANPPNLDEARSSVEAILRDGHAADETMQSIRTLFKGESLKKSQCSIPGTVRDAVRLLKEDPTMRDAAITPEFPANLPDVNVDRIQIQQVLINLMSNAIEATENTGRTPQVGITGAVLDERLVKIEISDNGNGIAEPDTLFQPFLTSKAKGMGIGLAVSRSIIEAHDGILTARNNLDQGATFSLTLPIFSLAGEPQTVAPRA
ncbi:PAS domain S-box protein [Paraburkholderia sp. DGU8]|uniref:PAS domain-containing sensor histidine kinase n=1 Tax=Paraburkholderia sp. DGU8 TaxID=3161997 RepID=UPI003467453B